MNAQEFKAAFAIAASNKDLSTVEIDHFFGFGLKDFEPVSTTLDAVAWLMRWQARYMNGGWDQEALDEIRTAGRKKFIIIDSCFVLPGTYSDSQKDIIKSAARMVRATTA
jgi:hypothetical protein